MPLHFPLVPSGSVEDVEGVPGATGPQGPSGAAGLNRGVGPAFGIASVLGNQAGAPLQSFGVSALGALPFVMHRSGSVTGVSVFASAPPTGSAIELNIYSGGSQLLTSSLAVGSYSGSIIFAPGTFPFTRGSTLDVRYSTTLSWVSPLTSLAVYLEVST